MVQLLGSIHGKECCRVRAERVLLLPALAGMFVKAWRGAGGDADGSKPKPAPQRRGRLWGTYRRYLVNRRGQALLVLAVSFVGGVAEALALTSLLPMLQAQSRHFPATTALRLVLVFLFAMAGSVALRVTAEALTARLGGRLEQGLRETLLRSLLIVDWRRSAELRHGELVTALMSESAQVANGVTAALAGLSGLAVAAVLLITAALIGGVLTAGVLVFALATTVLYRKATAVARAQQASFAVANANLNETTTTLLGGLKFYRATGTDRVWEESITSATESLRALRLRAVVTPSLTGAVIEVMGSMLLAGVLFVSLLHGDVARALIFLAVFYRVAPKFQSAQGQLLIARSQVVWCERWETRSQLFASYRESRVGTQRAEGDLASLRLVDAMVTFPGRDRGALAGVTLTLLPGTSYAVIGPTGDGKSTILDVLTGLLIPDYGLVMVNGRNLAELDVQTWRDQFAFVPQEPVLLHGSIAENIAWPAPIDRARMDKALSAAALSDFVQELPDGVETMVGHRATALSGGQRQRLALARAFYSDKQVLFLDEATSALDLATERHVIRNFLADPGRLVVFVTHRHEAARQADQIVVVEAGRVVACGSPEELAGALHG